MGRIEVVGLPARLARKFRPLLDALEQRPQTPDEGLRWVLRFVEQDVRQLSPGEQRALGWRIKACAPTVSKDRPGIQGVEDLKPLSVKTIQHLQQELRERLERLYSPEGHWPTSGPLDGFYLSRSGPPTGPYRIQRTTMAAFPLTWWLTVAEWLEEAGSQILRCPECSKLFMRTRRQAYCSARCSQVVRSRRWYAEHREQALEHRHERYAKAVRAATGAQKVKVARRRRVKR